MTGITVVVPTYRRPERLAMCLDGLRSQRRGADEVVVVVHSSDDESARAVTEWSRGWPALRAVVAADAGLVAALNHGLETAREPIVAFVDDDAVPSPDWTARILTAFAQDERIAAVGGRDIVVHGGRVDDTPPRRLIRRRAELEVGRIQWFGRMIANHHLGSGAPRDVDVIKGANMSYRREQVVDHGFDERLRGDKMQMHSELSICLPLRRRGWRIVYDPSIVVMHYPAPRPAGDQRDEVRPTAVAAAAHNEALAILEYFGPVRRLVFAVWALAVGTREFPGLVIFGRDLVTRRRAPLTRFAAVQRGRMAAWRTRRRTPRHRPGSPHVLGDSLQAGGSA